MSLWTNGQRTNNDQSRDAYAALVTVQPTAALTLQLDLQQSDALFGDLPIRWDENFVSVNDRNSERFSTSRIGARGARSVLWSLAHLPGRERGLSDAQYDALDAGVDEGDDILPDALARGDIEPVEHLIGNSLQRHGITLAKDSPSYRRLGYALLQAAVRANDSLRERQQGSIVKTPSPSAVHLTTPQRRNGVSLAELLPRWEREREPTPRARQEWGLVVRRFNALHGELPADLIEKKHVIEVSVPDVARSDRQGSAKVRDDVLPTAWMRDRGDECAG